MQNGKSRLQNAVETRFITLQDEEILLVRRKHWVVFLLPLLIVSALGITSFIASILIFTIAPETLFLIIPTFFLIASAILTLSIKAVIDWYFNIYIVTNKKIAEVSYKPLSSRYINEVLLNQVKCTEIDIRINGIINEFLDIGDIIITFDRPTHQEEFVLTNIKDPRSIEVYLERNFSSNMPREIENQKPEQNWILKKGADDIKHWTYQERLN